MPWFTGEICKTKLPRYHRTRGIIGRKFTIFCHSELLAHDYRAMINPGNVEAVCQHSGVQTQGPLIRSVLNLIYIYR
jgi:hypothetical protein